MAFVHCDRGVSRSARVLIAYLMRTYRWSFNDAFASVAEKRRIKPNENFKEQLQVWEAVGCEIWGDSEGKIPKAEYAAYLGKRAKRLQECGFTGDEPIGMQSLELCFCGALNCLMGNLSPYRRWFRALPR